MMYIRPARTLPLVRHCRHYATTYVIRVPEAGEEENSDYENDCIVVEVGRVQFGVYGNGKDMSLLHSYYTRRLMLFHRCLMFNSRCPPTAMPRLTPWPSDKTSAPDHPTSSIYPVREGHNIHTYPRGNRQEEERA
jgi:hypothetical protein